MLVIGLAGGTGSGKSTVARALAEAVADGHRPDHSHSNGGRVEALTILPQDAYYRAQTGVDPVRRAATNYDEPSAFDTPLLIEHIDALRRGAPIDRPVYDFVHHDRAPEVVPIAPAAVLVVEGILVLSDRELRQRFDLKVFVDAPPDERFIRRLQRDVRERGRSADSVIEQYRSTVAPMHQRYCEPSKRHADLIVPEGGENHAALAVLQAFVRSVVASRRVAAAAGVRA